MNTTVKSLQDVYVALGGSLTDTYEDIDGGVPVSDYTTIPDVIEAISQLAGKTLELPKTTSADTGKLLVVNEDGDWDKGHAPEELPTVTSEDEGDVLTVNAEGAWTNAEPAKELPAVTSSDNGSVLSVVDGAWGKKLLIKKFTFENVVPCATLSPNESWLWLDNSPFGRNGTASIISVFISTTNDYGANYMAEGIQFSTNSVGIKVRKNERGTYSTTTDPLSGEIYYIDRF